MLTDLRIKFLIERYLDKTITNEEYEELSKAIVETDDEKINALFEIYTINENDWATKSKAFDEIGVLKNIQDRVSENKKYSARFHWKFYAAACVLILFFILFVPWKSADISSLNNKTATSLIDKNEIYILENKGGYLTFSNGNTLAVNNQKKEFIDNGNIRYQFLDGAGVQLKQQGEPVDITKNKFWTGKGDKAHIVLIDGTTVWLSSSSSIVFHTDFGANSRVVEVQGEAFFDVMHDPEKPFIVKSNHLDVEVLGTRFNVKAYEDFSSSQTTLIEGSVKVRNGTSERKLVPGQKAVSYADGKLEIDKANIEDVLSWQTDIYRFSNLTINEILKEIARWYDVDEIKNKSIKQDRFSGAISKTNNLSEILNQLEIMSGNIFLIEERRVVVMD